MEKETMNSCWQDFLGASGARIDNGSVTDFGNLSAELVAAHEATVLAPLLHLGLIECTGDDATSFLHNQVTSDVNHLTADSAQHSAWCSAKGRMLASFLLYRHGSDFRALLSSDLISETQKRLQIFVMRSKVKVADISTDYAVMGLSGPQAEAALKSADLAIPVLTLKTKTSANGLVIRVDGQRFIIVADNQTAISLWKNLALHARPAGTLAWQWLEIQAGVPLITAATKEEFVPQMANFDKIGGVSFHKGCYPGQEIVARAQYLGKIKRHLYRIRTAEELAPAAAIYSPTNLEHACGMVANSAPSPLGGFEALAVIQEEFVAAGKLEIGRSGFPLLAIELVAS
ncbi:MAG: folate-binding protein [Betaproteobacteria bacterium]